MSDTILCELSTNATSIRDIVNKNENIRDIRKYSSCGNKKHSDDIRHNPYFNINAKLTSAKAINCNHIMKQKMVKKNNNFFLR